MDRARRALGRIGKREERGAADAPDGRSMPPSPQSGASQAKEGGHGDHWGCVVRATEQSELMQFISGVIRDASRPEVFEATGAGMAVHAPGDDVSATVLVVNDKLASAYPDALLGHKWPITVDKVVPWANGIEGQIMGTCHGASISFFDTRFYVNRRKYKIGETYDFQLSAFAYVVGKAAEVEFDSDIGAKVSLKGAHAYMPADINNPTADIDDYWFHSPLESEVGGAELAGRHLKVYPIIIALPDHFEMRINLYAARHTLDPNMEKVAPGDDLEGFLWLQGCIS